MTKFKAGDWVEIQAGDKFPKWNGKQRNSYEIGDYVITCTGHLGLVQSYALTDNKDRYYSVKILDHEGWAAESQGGEWMTRALKPEDVLGEDYFW